MPCIFPHIRFLALENSTLTFLLEFTTKLALSFAYIRVVFVQVQKGVKFRNLKYYCTKSNFWWQWMQLQKNQFPLSIAQHALQISNVCSHRRYFNFPRIPFHLKTTLQTFILFSSRFSPKMDINQITCGRKFAYLKPTEFPPNV